MDFDILMWILFSLVNINFVTTLTLPSWNMHFVCGQTIAQTERGGYIVFDADLLPVGHEDDCSVVIQPKPTYNQVTPGSYVLFYFSGFQIGNNCQDMYVEVNDGTGINIDPIKGLTMPMCGTNASLNKDVTFTSQSYFITVKYRRTQPSTAVSNFKSTFQLTFFTFSSGTCGSDEDLFSCANSRCVDKQFVCESLNPCGDNSDCPTPETHEDVWNIISYVIGFTFMGIFICFAMGAFKMFRSRGGGGSGCSPLSMLGDCCDCCCNACSSVKHRCCDACSSAGNCCQEACSSAGNSCQDACSKLGDGTRDCCRGFAGGVVVCCRHLKPNRTETAETVQTETETSGTATEAQPTSVSEFGCQTDAPPSAPPEPSAPPYTLPITPDMTAPPSYDEVVANETKYKKNRKR